MKRGMIMLVLAGLLACACLAFADKELPVFKSGDTVYVCGCGEGCPCQTISRQEGSCRCGKKLVTGVVDTVEGDKAKVTVQGKQQTFSVTPKTGCDCGGCSCGGMGQKQGKCGCGKAMKDVK